MASVPDYVKQAFNRWVQSWGWESREPTVQPYREMVFDVGDKQENWPVVKLLGKLWRCSEPLPVDVRDRMSLDEGATYAVAAQLLMAAAKRKGYRIPHTGFRVPFG